MKKNSFQLLICLALLLSNTSCEEDNPIPEEKTNPFEMEYGWNGFIINEKEYETPSAIIEIWGENLDSLSSDYDISFTDGVFDNASRSIRNYSVLVYFDINSPKLEELSTGTYIIENTITRKPGNIVEAYIKFSTEASILKYPVLGGEVTVSEQDGFYLVQYELKSVVDKKEVNIIGQYSGDFIIKDQTQI